MTGWQLKKLGFRLLVFVSNQLFGKEAIHRFPLIGWLNRFRQFLKASISPAHRRQARFERENLDAPWFVPAAIRFIEKELRPDFVGFEWGCGRSTLWLARRARHVTSVEGRRVWFDEVTRQLVDEDLADRVSLCLAEVSTEHDFSEAEIERYVSAIDEFADGSLDFIVVDGHFRDACLNRVGKKLRLNGLLIIDNTDVVSEVLLAKLKTNDFQVWNNGVSETTVIRNV